MWSQFGDWGCVPPELYLMIIEVLANSEDQTTKSALAILRLGHSSSSHRALISTWATRFGAKKDILELHQLQVQEQPWKRVNSEWTPISVLCKRLAGVCAICWNRQDGTEMFTRLQMCKPCAAFYAPKISFTRAARQYKLTSNSPELEEVLKAGRQAFPQPGDIEFSSVNAQHGVPERIIAWRDVKDLLNRGYLERRSITFWFRGRMVSYPPPFDEWNAEEFGHFVDPDMPVSYDAREGVHYDLLWHQICQRRDLDTDITGRVEYFTVDRLEFEEYRYKFDPSWVSYEFPEDAISEYLQTISRWLFDWKTWAERPWRVEAFPEQPRAMEVWYEKDQGDSRFWELQRLRNESWKQFRQYQTHCRTLRHLLKTCPGILAIPELAIRCTKNLRKKRDLNKVNDEIKDIEEIDRNWNEMVEIEKSACWLRTRCSELPLERVLAELFVRSWNDLRFLGGNSEPLMEEGSEDEDFPTTGSEEDSDEDEWEDLDSDEEE
jgi:hypothetical protein